MSTATDSEGKIVLVDEDADALLLFVGRNGADIGGFERGSDEFNRISIPADDVDFFVIELTNDIFDTGPAHANAGTDRVDFGIGAVDGDLGTEACLAGDGFQLNRAVGDFADFEFE